MQTFSDFVRMKLPILLNRVNNFESWINFMVFLGISTTQSSFQVFCCNVKFSTIRAPSIASAFIPLDPCLFQQFTHVICSMYCTKSSIIIIRIARPELACFVCIYTREPSKSSCCEVGLCKRVAVPRATAFGWEPSHNPLDASTSYVPRRILGNRSVERGLRAVFCQESTTWSATLTALCVHRIRRPCDKKKNMLCISALRGVPAVALV